MTNTPRRALPDWPCALSLEFGRDNDKHVYTIELSAFHDKRHCQVIRRFDSYRIACREWHHKCISRDKRKSYDRSLKVGILS